jgi:hypothetical protein
MDEKQAKTLEQVREDMRSIGSRMHMIAMELSVPIDGVFATLALSKREKLLVLAEIAAATVGFDSDMTGDDLYFIGAMGTFRDAFADPPSKTEA